MPALTNAQRQAKYRANRIEANNGNSDYRLNIYITSQSKFALKRLAKRYGVTQRVLIERLLLEAQESTIAKLNEDEEAIQAFMASI